MTKTVKLTDEKWAQTIKLSPISFRVPRLKHFNYVVCILKTLCVGVSYQDNDCNNLGLTC
jgi:hypothetical protein